jgi:hypothetical protein
MRRIQRSDLTDIFRIPFDEVDREWILKQRRMMRDKWLVGWVQQSQSNEQ